MKRHYDWEAIARQVELINKDGLSYRKLSKLLGIPVMTLHSHIDLAGKVLDNGTEEGFDTHENESGGIEITDRGDFPKSPEDLAKLAGIDLADYNIRTFDCFARQVYVKNIKKNLEFDEGKITGSIHDTGKMKIKTVWSSRLVVEPLKTKLRGVTLAQVTISMPRPETPKHRSENTYYDTLIIPDIHFGFGEHGPYHDEAALEAVLAYANWIEPDEIVLLGDLLDLAEFTDKFVLNPNAVNTTQRSIDEAAKFLAKLRHFEPIIPITLLEGNHEYRLSSQLRKYLMALAGLHPAGSDESISVATFLNLSNSDLDILYVDGWPTNYIQINDVKILHGDLLGSRPGQSVSKMIEKYKQSTIFGHTHHREYAEATVWSDALNDYKTIFSYSPGCLCRVDGSVPGSSPLQGWRQGIGILQTQLEGSSFIQDVPYDGKSKRLLF